MTSPIYFRWSGNAMEPLPRFAEVCDRAFVIGQTYRLEEREERSQASHSHYFASIHEAWQNLPLEQAERFPTPEHLRKWALVQAGYRDERSFAAKSNADALRLAAFVKPLDEYAVVVVREASVIVLTAKSQSQKAMGRKDFQDSKTKVLEIVWGLCGLTPAEAAPHVGKAA